MHRLLLSLLFLPPVLLAQDDLWNDEDWDEQETGPVWTGFVEAGLGRRLNRDPLLDSRNTLEDMRWRIESAWDFAASSLSLKADAGYDGIESDWYADVRDLSWSLRLSDSTDLKLGRQVQTWGTGDLLFLNDLFPKDFVSFFAGRDDEYLKAPGNAVRLTWFGKAVNVDFVWTPVFEPDVYLTGERFSYFSPLAGENVAPRPPLSAIEPKESLENGEIALRLFRTVEGREYAAYGYYGFFKQPRALTTDLLATFAPLTAIGASVRQPTGPGLLNAEISFYDSRDDDDGMNPLIPNSQLRFLIGYEWEAVKNLTVGLQYYLEWTLEHDALITNSPTPEFEPDEYRHIITNRLVYRAGRDKYTYSLFTFWSLSDRDIYLRPQFTYRHSDQWTLTAGGSIFDGDDPHTFFSQLEDASNLYVRVRYNY
jgi:hypothetical protein